MKRSRARERRNTTFIAVYTDLPIFLEYRACIPVLLPERMRIARVPWLERVARVGELARLPMARQSEYWRIASKELKSLRARKPDLETWMPCYNSDPSPVRAVISIHASTI
jgi:hypothetical protein